MIKSIIGLAFALAFAGAAEAKNFAVPAKNPTATISIPDDWDTDEIEYGYNAKSPDGDVFFSIESAQGKRVDKMLETNTAWMKDNKITPKGPAKEREIDLGGLKAQLLTYQAEDENGDTIVDFVFIDGGSNRLIFLTLWASEDERKANGDAIAMIQKSVKAIN